MWSNCASSRQKRCNSWAAAKHKVQRKFTLGTYYAEEKLESRERAANSKTKSRRKTQGREIHEKQLDAKDCRTKSRDESDDVGWVKERRIDGGGRVGRYGQNAWVSVAQRSGWSWINRARWEGP